MSHPAVKFTRCIRDPLVVLALVLLLDPCSKLLAAASPSPAVSVGPGGKLVYRADESGNRIPDFSHCGYAGGTRAIPDAPIRVVVPAQPGDCTKRIQKAIDYVATLPLDSNGLRGAVLLLKGRHEVFGSLRITNSGVVLRGQGMDEAGTVLVAAGEDRRTLIEFAGDGTKTSVTGTWEIADKFVPVGATTFRLKSIDRLKAGDRVRIVRPSTREWIERLGMIQFGGGEGDGRAWKPGSRDVVWDRVIVAIDAERVTLDAPITTALDEAYGGGRLEQQFTADRVENVGVENLRCESQYEAANRKDENHAWIAIAMDDAENCWVRQVTSRHFAGSFVAIWENCKWITVEDCISLAPISEEGGSRRETFFTLGQLALFLRCWAEQGRHDFAVGHCAAGPNAFVQCESSMPLRDSGPIESWGSGVLYDNVRIDGNGLSLANRGSSAQGAGWAAANSVLWQCSAAFLRCYNPPTAQNWAFGCWGEFEGDGIWRQSNEFVRPESLYVAQLSDRLGSNVASRVALMRRPTREATNPTIEEAQKLVGEARTPAQQLVDYIREAATRNPITAAPGDAPPVEKIGALADSNGDGKDDAAVKRLEITNGWLTCDGRLLIGTRQGVTWWRGNTRPGEAASFGLAITRFVPGRSGRGYTDDLRDLAASMGSNGAVALDHNYGLWYDRRRDDHQRVRRLDGDVWPPFFEQPFARSGRDQAWDGLSRYDLTRYNPWYWGRLKEFAQQCDQQGLLLLHENYFQHNILEAGAHWADCPWRTANNINDTGFPEPPPYAGDKRIFMAEQFYDVTHPERRKLHRAYIRKCLENFSGVRNVIQLTSAEFTGPLEFVNFWLDTIHEWEEEKGIAPLVALSCTKDVQDAVLSDPKRKDWVDLIDFKYWWQTDKGLFAPKGGLNLAPRQFERQWKGGQPTDENLAAMAAEYRAKFTEKPVICDFRDAAWAFLCAGGSLPNLPRSTSPELLAAIPKMKPWPEAGLNGTFVLRETGKQYLVYSSTAGVELGLPGEKGTFTARSIDLASGTVSVAAERILAGEKVRMGKQSVLWLMHEL